MQILKYLCGICVIVNVWTPIYGQTAITPNIPLWSDQSESPKKKLEAIVGDMGSHGKWITEYIKELEKYEKLNTRDSFDAVMASRLVGTPGVSIKLLKRLVKEYPRVEMPGTNFPISVGGQFQIGSAALYSGQNELAIKEYHAAIELVKVMPVRNMKSGLTAIALLYIAEIQSNQGKSESAIETLKRIEELPADESNDVDMPVEPYKAMAKASIESIRSGKPELGLKNRTAGPFDPGIWNFHLLLSGLFNLNGIGKMDIIHDRLMEIGCVSENSDMNKDCALLMRGYFMYESGDIQKAYAIFSEGLERQRFMSLEHGEGVIMCLMKMGKQDEANQAYKRIVELCPKAGESLSKLLKPKER